MPGGSPRGCPASPLSHRFLSKETVRRQGCDTADVQPDESPICSAKGCRAEAVWVLAWNNPKLHPPERRKAWATCEQHRDQLAHFLEMRGFLRETVPLNEWTPE
jgi:hypothetical protein